MKGPANVSTIDDNEDLPKTPELRPQAREEQLKILADAIPQIVWTANPDGALDYYNQKWFDYTGLTLEETKGWGWEPVIHPDDLRNCLDKWNEAVRTGNDYQVEYRFMRASDGEYRWHLGRAQPMRDSGGAIVKWFGTCTDIHDQLRAQDVLRVAQKQLEQRVALRTVELNASRQAAVSSEARFRAAADGMSAAFFIAAAVRDAQGAIEDFRLVDCNRVTAMQFGRERHELIGSLQSELFPDARVSGAFALLARVVETGNIYDGEFELKRAGGAVTWSHLRVVPLKDGVAFTRSDITDRRRMDEERSLHAAVVASISEGVCLVRAADRTILYANPKLARMYGYEDGEMEGRTTSIFRPPQEDTSARQAIEQVVQQVSAQGAASYETMNARKDGRLLLCRGTTTTLRSPEHGEVWVVVKEDITEQKRLEEELDGFFTSSVDLLGVAGFDGYWKRLNPAWETALGWTMDELKAKPWLEFVHVDDRPATIAQGQGLANGKTTIEFENRYACKDGRYRVLQWHASPSPLHGVIFASGRDVTQLREAQDALKASLSEKEVLLKEIHHRVKNNLQVVASLLKLHGNQITDPVAKGAFQDSQDRVRAIALLHENLYQSKNLGSVSMADYGATLLQTLMRTYGTVAPARVSIDAPGVTLAVDIAVPCGLILNELVTNSLKHGFASKREQAPEIRIAMIADDTEVTLSVDDNGCGLPAGFDLDRSRSLGMHLVRTLARQLRAKVTMTTGGGTHWTFQFPRIPGGEK
jgi:PAS domain S-box-containing protein